MTFSLNGFNNISATMCCEKNTNNGPVVMTSDYKVDNAADNIDFIGVCTSAKDGCARVLMQGYVEMDYTGSDPQVGYRSLVSSNKRAVKVNESATVARKRLVVSVDKANKKVGFIL